MGSHPEVGLGDRWTGHSHTVSHSVTKCDTVIGVTGVHITETGARVWNRPIAAPVPTVTMTSFSFVLFFLVVSSHARPQVSSHPLQTVTQSSDEVSPSVSSKALDTETLVMCGENLLWMCPLLYFLSHNPRI